MQSELVSIFKNQKRELREPITVIRNKIDKIIREPASIVFDALMYNDLLELIATTTTTTHDLMQFEEDRGSCNVTLRNDHRQLYDDEIRLFLILSAIYSLYKTSIAPYYGTRVVTRLIASVSFMYRSEQSFTLCVCDMAALGVFDLHTLLDFAAVADHRISVIYTLNSNSVNMTHTSFFIEHIESEENIIGSGLHF